MCSRRSRSGISLYPGSFLSDDEGEDQHEDTQVYGISNGTNAMKVMWTPSDYQVYLDSLPLATESDFAEIDELCGREMPRPSNPGSPTTSRRDCDYSGKLGAPSGASVKVASAAMSDARSELEQLAVDAAIAAAADAALAAIRAASAPGAARSERSWSPIRGSPTKVPRI